MLFGDVVILYTALYITLIIRYGSHYQERLSAHLLPFSIIFAIWILVFYVTDLYELSSGKNTIQFLSRYLYVMAFNIGTAIAFFYLLPFVDIAPKTNLFIFIALILAMEIAWRTLSNKLLEKSGYRNNTLIVGLNTQAQELYDFLLANTQLGYNALGIIDIKDQTAQGLLEKIITQKNVKTLVLGPEVYAIPQIIDVLYRLVNRRMRFFELSRFAELVTGKIPLSTIDQTWFLSNLSEGERRIYEVEKRAFDLFFSFVLSIITLPFYPFIMLLINQRPFFYQQIRVGRGGELFNTIKFRTMRTDAESATGPVWAVEDDQRVTKLGKWLRKSRIDEIPQVWNILKGEMSFVGPRPERPEFYEKLKREIPFYEERNLVAPGLTGWAQIKYKLDFRGGMTVKDTLEKVQYDLYYIKNRSILLDIGIILKTANILLTKFLRSD